MVSFFTSFPALLIAPMSGQNSIKLNHDGLAFALHAKPFLLFRGSDIHTSLMVNPKLDGDEIRIYDLLRSSHALPDSSCSPPIRYISARLITLLPKKSAQSATNTAMVKSLP
ncbi:hypothetical protein H6F46_04275 [Limnothrix sp. FACHB-1083]|uniref:hypothetical protein n=1 Tax=Limnothrix sp. FACHB-1088 TaxID=2692816 RepID=UPI0016806DBF|nr:hypothetical protein [Limnothrix sp. FACHB-1088]MBD2159905.1 hypothetical protein [Limnothrix sp. FACHB-1083]